MNKVEFVRILFSKASSSQRERIVDLAVEELGDIDELTQRIEGLENFVKRLDGVDASSENEKENESSGSESSNTRIRNQIHSPKGANKFLQNFTLDDRLKFFTHRQESGFNYEELMSDGKKKLGRIEEPLNVLTFNKIKNFCAPGEEGNKKRFWLSYSNERIEHSWSSVEQWCSENPGVYPSNAVLPPTVKEGQGSSFVSFDDIIFRFKKTIQIRRTEPSLNLKQLLKQAYKSAGVRLSEFDVSFSNENFTNVGLFIDVHLLFQGLTQFFKWIMENKARSNKIRLSLEENRVEECWYLSICHQNSELNCYPDDLKIRKGGGDLGKVKNWLMHVADWEINCKMRDGKPYRIIMLEQGRTTREDPPRISPLAEQCEGFTHILKLYKDTL